MPKRETETFECTVAEVFTLFCGLPLVPDSFACRKKLGEWLIKLGCPVAALPDGNIPREMFLHTFWTQLVMDFAANHVYGELKKQYPEALFLNEIIQEQPIKIPIDKLPEVAKLILAQAADNYIDMDHPLDIPPLTKKLVRSAHAAYSSNAYRLQCLQRWGWSVIEQDTARDNALPQEYTASGDSL